MHILDEKGKYFKNSEDDAEVRETLTLPKTI